MTSKSLAQSQINDIHNRRTGWRVVSVIDRFYDNCIPVPESGCWIWIGSVDTHGYGNQRINGKSILAHRLSAKLHKNESIEGFCVCHKCDTPLCVNPEHLFIGTKKDNTADMDNKGRRSSVSGTKNPRSKLTESDVIKIKQDVRQNTVIAKDYMVSASTVGRIKSGKLWQHL